MTETTVPAPHAALGDRNGRPLPVRYQPVLSLETLLAGGRHAAARPFPLDQPGVVLTFSGTAAVYQAFRTLRLAPGSVVLCPSYNCGHEIEPLLRLGLQVRCYRVTTELEPDPDDIARRLDPAVKALLVTHFFGFGQRLEPLRALCDQWGIALVEDCAHAFLSDNAAGNLGRLGDVAIYSFRKTVPIPNGGAVRFRDPALAPPDAPTPPPRSTTWLKGVELVKKGVLDRVARERSLRQLAPLVALAPLAAGAELLQRYWPVKPTAWYDPDDEQFDFDTRILGWGMAPLSERLLRAFDWDAIAARRRRNYRRLAEALADIRGCRLVRAVLPDSCCPLFLPVLVERRAEVFRFLVRQRIYPALWWDERHPAVAWEEFPEAVDLKARVLALPVHQDLDDAHVDRVADALRRCPAL